MRHRANDVGKGNLLGKIEGIVEAFARPIGVAKFLRMAMSSAVVIADSASADPSTGTRIVASFNSLLLVRLVVCPVTTRRKCNRDAMKRLERKRTLTVGAIGGAGSAPSR
jgi:hypothetical protein